MSTSPSGTASARKRVLIVDDHAMMRDGLARLIAAEPNLEVCGEAGDGFQALDLAAATKPDLVLADITMPGKSGVEFIKDLRAAVPGTTVLVVSMHDETLYAERALRAGARGYIMKQEGGQRLIHAIRQVLSGKAYVSEKISAKILDLFSGNHTGVSPVERLTDRELEIFQLVGQGKTTAQIAAELHLSPKTVEVHRAHIKEKLQLETSAEMIAFAARWLETNG
ncbi:MAG: response regulator transcription factor [Chthoniobacteraceae bacterium]